MRRPVLTKLARDYPLPHMTDVTADDTRLHPLQAMRAIKVLLATGDTRQIFVILRAMRGQSVKRNFRRFAQSPVGQRVLAERRDIYPVLTNCKALRALPDGSLGRAYLAFMEAEDLSAQALVQASESWQSDSVPPDVDLFRTRMRELHDLSHVVTGYGRDPLGEACLLIFTYRQQGNLGRLMIVAMAWGRLPKAARWAVYEAWRNGKTGGWFADQDWEALLARPLEEVRRALSIPVPALYRATAA
jgi:ubiquinone biosynthesis protein COQ4